MVLGVVELYTYSVYSTLLGHRREEMIKSGRGSLKVGVVAKISRASRAIIPTTPPY